MTRKSNSGQSTVQRTLNFSRFEISFVCLCCPLQSATISIVQWRLLTSACL